MNENHPAQTQLQRKRKLIQMIAPAAVTLLNTNISFLVIRNQNYYLKYKHQKLQLEYNELLKQEQKERSAETRAYMRNFMAPLGPPEHALQWRQQLEDIFHDPNRNYVKFFTHLYGQEFFRLAELVGPEIIKPRHRPGRPPPVKEVGGCKIDIYHRLFYCLHWMSSGEVVKISRRWSFDSDGRTHR